MGLERPVAALESSFWTEWNWSSLFSWIVEIVRLENLRTVFTGAVTGMGEKRRDRHMSGVSELNKS